MKRFTKVKWDRKEVVLRWTTEEDGDVISHTLKSKQPPHPDFGIALGRFDTTVAQLIEVELDWADALRVIGLSIDYDDEGRAGLIVTCLRELQATDAPLVLNMPRVLEPEGALGSGLPADLFDLLDRAVVQASAYLAGKRAQSDLFEDAWTPERQAVGA
ncbi:hypothetical protein [Candidatus Palauibacter sp.]|uniref:hypothetical protein n=1 Tax=Candidatus Palauibacter sp. TaxID=3101350 RepID=UPI003CC6CEE0